MALEFSTPVRSMTPDVHSRVPSSIKRSRMTPALASSSTYETPPPQPPLPSAASNIDSAEYVHCFSFSFVLKSSTYRFLDELWRSHFCSKNIRIVLVYWSRWFKNIRAGEWTERENLSFSSTLKRGSPLDFKSHFMSVNYTRWNTWSIFRIMVAIVLHVFYPLFESVSMKIIFMFVTHFQKQTENERMSFYFRLNLNNRIA